MPTCFRNAFPKTRVIIDCTKFFIETPSSCRSQSVTVSNYTNHNTAKALRGISPSGYPSFVSSLFVGRTSDKKITMWSNTSNKNLTKLQHVQNYTARIVTKARKFEHVAPALKLLKWIPVKDMLYFCEAVMTYKCINNLTSTYLCSKVTSCQQRKRHYNLRNDGDLSPPKFRTTSGQRTFIYRACKIWNTIDESVKLCENISTFKNKLKNVLIQRFISA
jgi:hypothetical protein